jgi:hypothetical protein
MGQLRQCATMCARIMEDTDLWRVKGQGIAGFETVMDAADVAQRERCYDAIRAVTLDGYTDTAQTSSQLFRRDRSAEIARKIANSARMP